MKEGIDVEDIEAFIDGLKTSIDSLDTIDPTNTQGFQSRLAKAISELRLKKVSKISELQVKKVSTKEDVKNFLLNELEFLKKLIDSTDINRMRKFSIVMKIASLREKINSL